VLCLLERLEALDRIVQSFDAERLQRTPCSLNRSVSGLKRILSNRSDRTSDQVSVAIKTNCAAMIVGSSRVTSRASRAAELCRGLDDLDTGALGKPHTPSQRYRRASVSDADWRSSMEVKCPPRNRNRTA
jgi:hypothetical protein